jgi:phosphate-selective porin
MKRFLLVCAALTGVLVFGVHAQAAVDSSDILIKALVDKGVITEDEAASVRAEIANIRQDEEASRKSYNITGKRPIKIGGYVQERYTGASQAGFNDTLEPKRVRLVVNGDATERLDFKVQVDFAGSRKGLTAVDFAKTKSTTAQFGKPLLLDAVLGYKLEGDRRLDIGQFKVPFSIENLTSSPFLDLITRSVVVEALVPGRDTGNQGRDIGAQYSGVRNLREDGSRQLQYFAGVFDGAGINVPDDNDRKDSALRAVIRPGIEGLSLGASWYHGAIGSTELSHDRVGGELVYSRGPWKVQSEYIAGKDAAVH